MAGAALASYTAKAGTRALVNTSPEPFTNVALSGAEDVTTGGLLVAALAHPAIAGSLPGRWSRRRCGWG